MQKLAGETSRRAKARHSDMHGTTIQTLMVPAGVGQQRINVPGVLPGSYQLSWTNGMQKAYQTILILRQ